MKEIRFKVTNKEEYDDLMQTIERERPEVRWKYSLLPPTGEDNNWAFPTVIELKDELIYFYEHDVNLWKIGQTLTGEPTALQSLISIPQNEDGSITISPELQAKLVVALRGGEK